MTYAQQALFKMALSAGYEPARRACEAMRPVTIGELLSRAALRFAMYEMEGRR